MINILLTGKNGQVGWELQRTLAPLGKVCAVDFEEMDLTNPDSIRNVVRQVKPLLIVNPAAYTAVDKAESEAEIAMAINGTAAGVLAEEAKRLNAVIVHYSTDYIFDGTKKTPYVEDDMPAPLNVYGKTKLAGEIAIRESGASHLIFRTSWVYGARGKNFMLTILRLAAERDELRLVADQIGAPTWCRMLAEATAQALHRSLQRRGDAAGLNGMDGVYHMTNGGQTSWYGFAKTILENQNAPQRNIKLAPIPATEYPVPAQRPANSVMSNDKLEQIFQLRLPAWDKSLELCMRERDRV